MSSARVGLVAATALLALGATLPARSGAATRTVSAAAFRDSVGVVAHPTYFSTSYGDWTRVLARLGELGVGHLRVPIAVSSNAGWNDRLYDALEAAVRAGIDLNLVVARDCSYDGQLQRCLDAAREEVPAGGVEALEWPNEYDLSGRPGWAGELVAWGRALHQQANADPVLSAATIVGPSFGRSWGPAAVGDQSAHLDVGNIHPYTGATSPDPAHLASEKARIATVSGAKPVIATEAGFHTSPAHLNPDQPAADEPTAAVYTLRTVLEHVASGVDRTYLYELLDLRSDPMDSQANYGLLRSDFSAKPAFTALRNLLAMTGAQRPATVTPLQVAVAGDTTDLRTLALQHDAVTYTLVLWRTASVWDRVAQTPLAVAPEPYTVTVAGATSAASGNPLQGPALTPRAVDGGRLALSVGAAPVVLRLTTEAPALHDTWTDASRPPAVHGAEAFVQASHGPPAQAAWLRFDVGRETPATVKLRVHATAGTFASYSVWRTAEHWDEGMTAAEIAAAAPLSTWQRVASGVTFPAAGRRDVVLDADRFGRDAESLAITADNGGAQRLQLVSAENGFGGGPDGAGPRLVVTR